MNGSTAYAPMVAITVSSAGLFVAVGYFGLFVNEPVYATSTNGSNWTTPALMNGSTANLAMEGVAVNSAGLFVAVGLQVSPGFYPAYAWAAFP
jgi:hypothetical protein